MLGFPNVCELPGVGHHIGHMTAAVGAVDHAVADAAAAVGTVGGDIFVCGMDAVNVVSLHTDLHLFLVPGVGTGGLHDDGFIKASCQIPGHTHSVDGEIRRVLIVFFYIAAEDVFCPFRSEIREIVDDLGDQQIKNAKCSKQ